LECRTERISNDEKLNGIEYSYSTKHRSIEQLDDWDIAQPNLPVLSACIVHQVLVNVLVLQPDLPTLNNIRSKIPSLIPRPYFHPSPMSTIHPAHDLLALHVQKLIHSTIVNKINTL
jgi:hypothetical protein